MSSPSRPPRVSDEGRASVVGALRAGVGRLVWFALAWWALSEGDPSTIRYGIPAVALALAVSLALSPPRGPRRKGSMSSWRGRRWPLSPPRGPRRKGPGAGGDRGGERRLQGALARAHAMLALAAWFARQAVVGGADVALRALRRPVAIDPVVVTAPVALPPGGARQVALVLLNLMPGTLVQAHEGDEASVHALSPELPVLEQWNELQTRIAAAAGLRLSTPEGPSRH